MQKVNDSMLEKDIKLETDSIVLYGAGYAGLHFCELLIESDIWPICFLDRDKNKCGREWKGIEILNLEGKSSIDRNVLIIVCLLKKDSVFKDIMEQLRRKGFYRIVHMSEIQVNKKYEGLFKNQNLILYADKGKIAQNYNKIRQIRELLEDEGKRTYDEIFRYIDSDFQSCIHSFPLEEQYWAYDLFTKNEKEVVFDCGAFDGTVMKEFIKRNNIYKAYYAFEPDRANADRILKRREPRVFVIQKALSDKNECVSMRNYMNMNSVIIKHGDFNVESMKIDDLEIIPTFIKIDVEGYEEKVLQGGGKTIENSRPIIACAMYHSVDQLWNIPQMIIDMTENYIYSVRSYMNLYETVFYAIPEERKNEIYK